MMGNRNLMFEMKRLNVTTSVRAQQRYFCAAQSTKFCALLYFVYSPFLYGVWRSGSARRV